MTPKKLQKLAYYFEAWGWALLHRSVISDTHFEAWAHGPVSPELWREYHAYGWNKIDKEETAPGIDNQDLNDLLEAVWVTYGDKSANELEALTHTETPWIRARGGLKDGDRCSTPISDGDMERYYASIYNGD
nr:type II toxin-antitoxin system antitoxin SocA domain-containing protein [Furfurilactobacillus milii]